MTIERCQPAFQLGEREMLEAWLDYHRATLALKCAGLRDDQLRQRAVPPSTMSLLGLVRHMADVEAHWFRRVLAGHDDCRVYWSDANPDGDFDDVATADVEADFKCWRGECDNARTVSAPLALDDCGTGKHGDAISLRWVYVHMIEEYARHNGHADLLRQCIDGSVGD